MGFDYSLFDTLLEPVFVLSSDGKVVYCNEPASLVCELSVRKITRGMQFKDLLTFSEPIEWLQDLNAVKSPAPYKEVVFTSPSGTVGKVQITVQPFAEEESRWIVFVRDVTLEERLQKKYRAELEQKEDVILALQKAQSELEEYSKNLEKMVQERTHEISRMNRLMKALLDSLSQGFFVFDQTGLCLEVSSRACQDTVESLPAGQRIWDVLKLPENKVHGFQRWMSTLFSEMLPFADLSPLGPASYAHSAGKNISLEYFPLRSDENQIDGVVVVATDITNLVEAQRQAVVEKQHSEMIIHLVRNKNQVSRFLRESQELLEELNSLLKSPSPSAESVFRCLHTLKGGAGMLSILNMTEACHSAETTLTELSANSDEAKRFEILSSLKKQCSEVSHNFEDFKSEAKEVLGSAATSEERLLEVPLTELKTLLSHLQTIPEAKQLAETALQKFILVPIESYFSPYKEAALKLAEKQEKTLSKVDFVNGELSVMPEVYDSLFATFIHAFRNAVDHGLETEPERVGLGKPAGGELTVHFELLSFPQRLRISIKDDGRGIDPEKIRSKLIAKFGATHPVASESEAEVIQHVFDSQFSTKENITDISGRGVGLDAVRSEAEALGGKAWVESKIGHGSTLMVEVPWLQAVPGSSRKAA